MLYEAQQPSFQTPPIPALRQYSIISFGPQSIICFLSVPFPYWMTFLRDICILHNTLHLHKESVFKLHITQY